MGPWTGQTEPGKVGTAGTGPRSTDLQMPSLGGLLRTLSPPPKLAGPQEARSQGGASGHRRWGMEAS